MDIKKLDPVMLTDCLVKVLETMNRCRFATTVIALVAIVSLFKGGGSAAK